MRDSIAVRRRHVQVHRRAARPGSTSGSRPRARSAASSSIRAIPNIVFVAALGHVYGPHPDRGVYRSTRRRRDLAEGSLQGRRHRRDRPRVRSREPADRLRGAVGRAASAVVHLRAGERPRQRPLQIDRRRRRRGTSSTKACRPKASAAWASRSRRPIRRRIYVDRRREGRRPVSLGRRRRDVHEGCRPTSASGGAAGTSRRSPSIRRTPTSSTCRTPASTSRPTAARRGARRSRRRPAATTITSSGSRPTIRTRMIVGGDQGTIVSVDGGADLELLVQPADRAALSRRRRLPLSLLADRRAAGQRRGRRARRASHVGASRCTTGCGLCAGGESGYTAPDPLHPDILFGGTVEKCNVVTGETKNVTPETPRARRAPIVTPGRSRSSSRRRIAARSTSPTSSSTRRSTAARAGRRSAAI